MAWVAVTPGLASADPISDKRRQASHLVDQIERLNTRAEVLAEQYNKAVIDLQGLTDQVRQAQDHLNQRKKEISLAQSQMGEWALQSYIHAGATDPLLQVLVDGNVSSDVALRDGYVQVAVGADQRSADELRRSREDAQNVEVDLQAKLRLQAQLKSQLDGLRAQVQKATGDAQALLSRTQGQLHDLVVQEEAARAAAAEAAVRARVAAAAGGRGASGGIQYVTHVPPPPSPGAAGAVAAAMSMLGVPYVWAGASPGGFDCSGLVMWAWARAGRPGLPHNALAQYESLPHVNISDLQPGDLVFFGSDIHHVGMYIGGGMMVNAPQTGDVVRTVSVYQRDLVGAARP